MKPNMRFLILIVASLVSFTPVLLLSGQIAEAATNGSTAQTKNVSMLFIGNSHTYIPAMGNPEDPGVPKMVVALAKSIDPSLNVTFSHSTPGGYRLEQHFNNVTSVELLKRRFDKVVIQANSIEPLELPPWFLTTEDKGVVSFGVYLPKILDLAFEQNTDVTLYVTWGWNAKHEYLQASHPGLYFPQTSPKAGQRWCGANKYEYQNLLDASWFQYSQGYKTKFALVGDTWLALQDAGVVNEDELYAAGDWSHASIEGAYVSALVLTRDVLGLDVSKADYAPEGLDPKLAATLRDFIAPLKGLRTFER